MKCPSLQKHMLGCGPELKLYSVSTAAAGLTSLQVQGAEATLAPGDRAEEKTRVWEVLLGLLGGAPSSLEKIPAMIPRTPKVLGGHTCPGPSLSEK